MDSDAVFAAEAALNNGARDAWGRDKQLSDEGERDVLAATGGIDTLTTSSETLRNEQETSPLLPQATRWTGMDEFASLPWNRRPSIIWILVPFFLMATAFGGVITSKINLITNLVCREYFADLRLSDPNFTMGPIDFIGGDNDQCRLPAVQARVAYFTLWGGLISGLISAVTSPKLGALSDRFGRKPILVATSFGTIAGEIITIIAANKPESFHVNWMLVGYGLEGLTGSFIVALAIGNSYAADCTPPNMRNVAFGYLHGCLFTGLAIGPILAGYVVKYTGTPVTVFYILVCVHVFFILFISLCVPESLSKKRQQHARETHKMLEEEAGPQRDFINQLRAINLLEPLKILRPTGEGATPALRRNLLVLAAVDTIVFGVAMGSMTVVIIYTRYAFGWQSFESARFMSIVNTSRVIFLVGVLPLVTRLVRGKAGSSKQNNSGCDNFELYIIRLAVFFDMLGYLGYTLSRTGGLMTLSGAVAAVGGVGSPTLQAALTKHVTPDRTGQLLGATGLLHALARVVAPTIFNAIYAATVGNFTQTVFVCLTATFGVAFVASWFIRPHVYFDEHPDERERREERERRVTDERSNQRSRPLAAIFNLFGGG